jgi:ABC-type spermidine/putrescine transport system permease subunit I
MRMLAWIGLLAPDGYVDVVLGWFGIAHTDWLNGNPFSVIAALTYGYIPYLILPVYAGLDRIDLRLLEAARDLGASATQALRHVLFPLLLPAALAGMLIVFALSIDDFVVTQYMSSGGETTTIPMLLYVNARGGATTPALNAVATIMVVVTLIGVGGAYLILRWFARAPR